MINHRLVQFLTLLLVLGAGLEASKQATTDDGNVVFDVSKDDLRMSLRFEPPEIDFGQESVGIARSHKVTLVNENANRSVYLSSVSGRTPIFFASFMDTRVILPKMNTTFDVVFLPRKSVLATDTLLVSTSFGQARLLVRGQGFECPYRLKPIVGIKAPLNALLTPEIYMYNPHERPLQIIEIYSSGGQFQLELPSGLSSAPQALWEIPPHSTKPIIRIKFHGNSAGNHSAFIRIKIASQSLSTDKESQAKSVAEDVLVVPVEFEIFGEQGVYAPNPVLDFGRLTNEKPKKPIQLKMKLDSSDEHNSIEKVSISASGTLPPGLSFQDSDGGSLTLNTAVYNKTTTIDELVTLQATTKDNKKPGNTFTVRVRAEIFKGALHFNRNASIIVSGAAEHAISADTRTLSVRNDFEEPIAIHNVSFEALNPNAIRIDYAMDFRHVLQPGQMHDLLHLNLKEDRTHFQANIRVSTNITEFDLPLVVCSGRLHVTTYHEPLLQPQPHYNTELNMGAVPLEDMSRDGFIMLQNPNPISVRIVNWNFKSPQGVYFHSTSMGCLRPAALAQFQANQSVEIETANFRFCAALSEGDILVFKIAIQSHITELRTAALQIWTPHETITTTVLFHTSAGKLEVDQAELYFKNCFPGKVCSSDLSIRSTFQNPIHITAINFADDLIRFPDHEGRKPVYALSPNAVTRLGRIYFEPAQHCHNRCYLPQGEKLDNLTFPRTTQIENNNFHYDGTELRRRTDLYRQMKRQFRTIPFTLTSRELRQVQLQANIDLKWPKLVVKGAQKMPTTVAGKFQEFSVRITNPAYQPMLLDYFLANPAYAQQTKLSFPIEVVDMSSPCYLTDQAVFTLTSPVQKPILLPPHASLDVAIRFDAPANSTDTFCTLLHIRNNLTLYEAVWVSAKSVESQFRFGNRLPGTDQPFKHDVSELHLAACQQQHQPPIVKRIYTARNTGEVPIRVLFFLIDDQLCEGYGFKVFNCGEGFVLKANGSRKVEIAYQPDFTQIRVTRTLSILTNLSYDINYTLHVQLPPAELLQQCADTMPRPTWEKHIRITGVLLLLLSFVMVLAAANVDAENIGNTQSALYAAREKGAVQPTFNLRNIAIKANQPTTTTAATASKCTKTSNSTTNSNGNQQAQRVPNKTHNHSNSNSHQQQQQHKNARRRTTAQTAQSGGSGQRKYTAFTESATNDASDFKNSFDEKFALEFEISNGWQDSYDCSPSSSSNSSSFKSSPSPPKSNEERGTDVLGKKQKTQAAGKPRNTNRKGKSAQTTPPPTRNPILELMDKDVAEAGSGAVAAAVVADKSSATKLTKPKAEPTLLKRITESIAAAVSIKEKARIEKPPKTQRTEDDKTKLDADVCDVAKNVQALDNAQQPKTQTKSDSNLTQQRVPANDPEALQQSKQKPQDTLNNALKPRAADGVSVKSSNYVGPIRNMESYQNPKAQSAEIVEIAETSTKLPVAGTEQKPPMSAMKVNVETKNHVEQPAANFAPPTAHAFPLENKPTTPSPIAINSAVVKPMNFNNLANAQPPKHGKTPGRERSRDNSQSLSNSSSRNSSNGHLNEQKFAVFDKTPKNKAIKTLNFDEDNCGYPMASTPTTTPTPTPLNNQKYAFEQQPSSSTAPAVLASTPIHVDSEKGALYIDLKARAMKRDGCLDSPMSSNALPPEKSNSMAESISNIFKDRKAEVQQQKGTELGPIGTKKSPSSTPVWESIVGSSVGGSMRAPLQPKVLDSNNSFFTTLPTAAQCKQENALARGTSDAANFNFNVAQSFLGELGNVTTASFYELKKAQAQLQRQLEANEFLLHLRSKQLEEERRQRRQQQEFLKSITQWPHTSNVTPNEGATWGPIGAYAGNSVPMGFNENHSDGKKSLSPALDQFDAWPMAPSTSTATTASTIRPPPGLGQPQRHPNNNSLHNSNSNLQDDGVRTFDPFSSLGSIWSDSWKQPNNQN